MVRLSGRCGGRWSVVGGRWSWFRFLVLGGFNVVKTILNALSALFTVLVVYFLNHTLFGLLKRLVRRHITFYIQIFHERLSLESSTSVFRRGHAHPRQPRGRYFSYECLLAYNLRPVCGSFRCDSSKVTSRSKEKSEFLEEIKEHSAEGFTSFE